MCRRTWPGAFGGSDGTAPLPLRARALTCAPSRHSAARSMSGTVKNIIDGASWLLAASAQGWGDEAVLGGGA
jgi:hypothetical protein